MSDFASYKRWLLDKQALQVDLQKLIESPVFVEAVKLALYLGERDTDYVSPNLIEVNALSHAENRGAQNLIKRLQTLANPPVELLRQVQEVKPLPRPFEHYKNEPPVNTLV